MFRLLPQVLFQYKLSARGQAALMDKGLIMVLEITKVCFEIHILKNGFLNFAYIFITHFLLLGTIQCSPKDVSSRAVNCKVIYKIHSQCYNCFFSVIISLLFCIKWIIKSWWVTVEAFCSGRHKTVMQKWKIHTCKKMNIIGFRKHLILKLPETFLNISHLSWHF